LSLAKAASGHSPTPTGLLLLGSLALFWGLAWPTLKIVLDEMPVLPFRAICVAFGAGALLLAKLSGERIHLPRREILPLTVAGLLNVTLWQILMAYGLNLMPAGHASIIAYTMPAFATLFGWLLLKERVSRTRLWGLLLSMAGLGVLIVPEFGHFLAAPLGVLLMVGAAASWAGGTVAMKYFPWTVSIMQSTGWQFLLGGLPVIAAAILAGEGPHLAALSLKAWVCLIYVLAIPVLFCQWAWFKAVDMLPGSVSAMGTLAIPVVGTLSGAALLGETLGISEIAALALVVAGLGLVVLRPTADT
jgi:drug/metabolite transporter (DMT)-like permease